MSSVSVDKLGMPANIELDSTVVDVAFHPEKDVIAVGDIDGDVTVHSYSVTEKNHLLMTLPHHKKSCRAVRFSPDGSLLYTISKDRSLQAVDMGQGAVTRAIKDAHSAAIYSLLVADENIVVTGDDDGNLKVWDMRYKKAVVDVTENSEFISDLALDDKRRYLLATCGDGTLTSFDIRKHKMKLQSELFDSEFLSVAIIKCFTATMQCLERRLAGGEKVVCGSGEGCLQIFNWGEWGNISDRFPGHPMSIDCIVPLTRDVILTGSMDGVIRTVQIHPNRFLADVGRHGDLPVEALSLSRCRRYVASCGHDDFVRFWNVENAAAGSARPTARRREHARKANVDSFFSDMAADEAGAGGSGTADGAGGDESSDSDSDEGGDGDDAAASDVTSSEGEEEETERKNDEGEKK